MRYTVVLDEHIASRVRQMFGGNLSKGINSMLAEHLEERKSDDAGFGLLKSHGPALRAAVKKLRQDDQVD